MFYILIKHGFSTNQSARRVLSSNGSYTTREIHTKLHPGPKWSIFHILTSEYIDDVIFRFFSVVCAALSFVNIVQFTAGK